MKYNRLLVILAPTCVLLFFEAFFFKPKLFFFALALSILVILFTVQQFTRTALAGEDKWKMLGAAILPVLFLSSIALYSTLAVSKLFTQFLFIVNIFFLYYYLRYIYFYLVQPMRYKEFTLENISAYGNFLLIYFFASAIYGLQSFLSMPVWSLMLIFMPIIGLVVYQVIWVNKLKVRENFIFILLSCVILVEISWAISFLPLKYNVVGLILAICYYLLIGLIRFYLSNKLNRQIVKLYLAIFFVSIITVLLTARWM